MAKRETTYIHRVETNLLAGVGRPEALDLTEMTLLHGENGVGKSRILYALSLGLEGVADDFMGKTKPVKTSADLVHLIPPGEDQLEVVLHFRGGDLEGKEASFRINAEGGKARRPDGPHVPSLLRGSEWLMPVRRIASWLRKSPNSARAKFLPYVVSGVSSEDIRRKLPEMYEAPEQTGGKAPESIDELVTMIDLASKRIKREGDRARELGQQAEQQGQVLDPEPTDAQLEEAEAAVSAAQTVLAQSGHAALQQQLAAAKQELAGVESQIDQVAPKPQEPDPQMVKLQQLVREGAQLREKLMAAGMDLNTVTGLPMSTPEAQAGIQKMHNVQANLTGQLTSYNTAQSKRQRAEGILRQKKDTVANLERMLQAQGASPGQAAVPRRQAEQNLEAANNLLRSLRDLRAKYESARSVKDDAAEASTLKEWWSGYKKALEGVVEELIEAAVDDFCTGVQRYLPPQYTFHLSLRDDNGRQVFRLGLEHEGHLYTHLSGAQRALAYFALTAAVLDRLPGGPPPFALFTLPEERALSRRHLKYLMRAFAKVKTSFPYQIIIGNIVRQRGQSLQPWSVIDLDEIRKKAKKALEAKGEEEEGEAGDDAEDAEDAEDTSDDAGGDSGDGGDSVKGNSEAAAMPKAPAGTAAEALKGEGEGSPAPTNGAGSPPVTMTIDEITSAMEQSINDL